MLENLEAAQFYTALGKVLTKEDLLFQKKWRCLLKHRRFFFLIPFLDFVLVAGSMALGNINEESDFDMIVGCQKSRIFTVRFFTIVIFGLFGLRRKSTDDGEKQKDKFCFNHFVTSSSYRLRPPYNIYWQELYRHLVPIYGDKSAVIKFLQANEWVKRREPRFDGRWQSTKFNLFRRVSEVVLGGKVGNFFERIVKFWQLRRIQKKIPPAGVGRVYISDEELEFHPDLRRIEEVVGRKTFQILDRI